MRRTGNNWPHHLVTKLSPHAFIHSSVHASINPLPTIHSTQINKTCRATWIIVWQRLENPAVPTVHNKFQPRWLSDDNRGKKRQQDERIHLSRSSAVCCKKKWFNRSKRSTKSSSSFLCNRLYGPSPICCVPDLCHDCWSQFLSCPSAPAGGSVWRSRGIRLHLGNKRQRGESVWPFSRDAVMKSRSAKICLQTHQFRFQAGGITRHTCCCWWKMIPRYDLQPTAPLNGCYSSFFVY